MNSETILMNALFWRLVKLMLIGKFYETLLVHFVLRIVSCVCMFTESIKTIINIKLTKIC